MCQHLLTNGATIRFQITIYPPIAVSLALIIGIIAMFLLLELQLRIFGYRPHLLTLPRLLLILEIRIIFHGQANISLPEQFVTFRLFTIEITLSFTKT
jgi:hypothetical protein